MSLPQGINFRSTSAYVTDGADHTYEIGLGNNYPRTTPQGNTVGWETATGDARNRSTSNDTRLAGFARTTGTAVGTYRIDLPSAGSYSVRVAAGDASYASGVKVEAFDTSTSLGVLASTSTTAANKFRDATNAEHTAANWPANNASATLTFATTICRIKTGIASGGSTALAHVYVASAGGGGGVSASGTPDDVTLTAATGSATGGASASGSVAAISTTAPAATATGSASASASPAAIILTAPAATATTGGAAAASGAPAELALTAPTGSATGAALATATPAPIGLTAATGSATASGGGSVSASGTFAPITLSAPTSYATGAATVSAALAAVFLTAPTGSASDGSAAVLARRRTRAETAQYARPASLSTGRRPWK